MTERRYELGDTAVRFRGRHRKTPKSKTKKKRRNHTSYTAFKDYSTEIQEPLGAPSLRRVPPNQSIFYKVIYLSIFFRY